MRSRLPVLIVWRRLAVPMLMSAALVVLLAVVALSLRGEPAGATGLDNNGVTTWLEPEGDSGVRGTASIAVQPGGARLTVLSLYVEGLAPGPSYPVHVHSGTRAAPSASFGFLGSLEPDASGRAELLTSTMISSALGAVVDLSLELLADGNHLIEIHAPDGAIVASGEIPFAVPTGSYRVGSLIKLELDPVADSAASGTAMVTSKTQGPAWVALELKGLQAGSSYVVRLHAGSCETPSASFGTLGTLVGEFDGRGYLLSTSAEMSNTGAAVDLSMDLLMDGDHLIAVLDATTLQFVACAAVPRIETPAGSEVEIAPTGIQAVDAAISTTLRGDSAGLAALVRLTEIPCGPETAEGFALVAVCEDGEPEGTPVPVLPAAACEGYWARDPLPVLETFAQHSWRLHAVVRGPEHVPSDSLWPAADYLAIFTPRPGSFIDGLAAYVQDGDLVAVLAGCPSPDDLMLGPDGQPLPLVFMPAHPADPIPAVQERELVAQVAEQGGLCVSGQTCWAETSIYADGTLTRNSSAGQATALHVDPEQVHELQAQIGVTDLPALRSRPFSGLCPVAYDAMERTYRFITPIEIVELPECTFDIDRDAPVFRMTDALVDEAAQHAEMEPAEPTDLDRARESLRNFFSLLHAGRYGEAALLYGGSYETLESWNPMLSEENKAELWEAGCKYNGLQCLPMKQVVLGHALSPTDFIFVVEFETDDGSLFVLGPCCGATEDEMPSRWQWLYSVWKYDGEFKVQGLPVYVP